MRTKLPKLPSSLDELLWLGSQIKGFDQGTNERADILTQAADGSDINEIWREIQRLLTLWNGQRDRLVNQFTYRVQSPIENVGIPSGADFEEASEYGQPTGIRGFTYKNRGYDFKFYDLAIRYTWMFLAEAGRAQIENLANMALEADDRLIFNKVMKTLFNPTNLLGIADQNIPTTVYKFYNGDGEVPPTWKNNTFTGSHTHYSTSLNLGAAAGVFVAADLDAVEDDLIKHGYSPNNGATLVVMLNRQEGAIARKFRVDAASNPGRYDFIPSSNYGGGVFVAPRLQGTMEIVARPQGNVPGEVGTYGPFHIVEEEYCPPGYVAVLASGGPDSLTNPIGIREHTNPAYRGLQLIPGQRSDYPLTDSFYRRGFGTGIRQRGAGFIFQVVNSATYTVPAIYA